MTTRNDVSLSSAKAKATVYRLLKIRPRSECEIVAKLKDKKFSSDTIEQVVCFCKKCGLIDDALFAKGWISSRLAKPLGLRKIRQELKAKGITEEIISMQLKEMTRDYNENKAVEHIIQKRAKIYQGLDSATTQRRLEGYLLRRGFSPEVIYKGLSFIK